MNDQGLKYWIQMIVKSLRHFNIFPITSKVVFISQIWVIDVVALNASDLAVLIEYQPLDLWFGRARSNFQTLVVNFDRPNLNFDRECTEFLVACVLHLLKYLQLRSWSFELLVNQTLTLVINALNFQRASLLLYFSILDFGRAF